ncbi:multidrug effflux MFS transporter [Stenotrophomonas sp. YIM B06876]|uniref:multidrug effflux MFS transporter n=1 Tax=Stenotrophomonas sp. YIM B06876 TaxID=3060211 RepID=UPI002739269C|nr:multidrug effflux MFS transporter [Stenotrophomonas sp. YIM B06876]
MHASKQVSLRRIALLVGGLSMFGPFAIDAVFPAFPQIGQQLGADKLAMQQVISVYLLTYALMSLMHGALSDALGRKRVIVAGLVVFIGASIGCALSRDMGTLLFFRALQGLSAGVGYIIGRAVIRDLYDGDDAQRLMSQVSMIFSIAPAIAPVIGGWLLGWSNWMGIFWFLVAFSTALLAITCVWLPETHPAHARLPLKPSRLIHDYLGIAMNTRFLRLAAAGSLGFGGLFLYIASAPAFVLDLLHLNEQQFAWLFIPTIAGMALGAYASGRAAGRMAGARAVRIGYLCIGISTLFNIGYNALAGQMTLPWAVLPMTLNSFGIALIFPILSLAILDMYPRQRGSASSMQAFTTLVTNAVIAGVLSPLLSRNGLYLALGAGVFALASGCMWSWESRAVAARGATASGHRAAEANEHA